MQQPARHVDREGDGHADQDAHEPVAERARDRTEHPAAGTCSVEHADRAGDRGDDDQAAIVPGFDPVPPAFYCAELIGTGGLA